MPDVRTSTKLASQLDTLYNLGSVGSMPDDRLVEMFLARDEPAASEAAFSALIDRHGSMVLSVCQRVLQNPHDAHDAFQATFMVLVRKAASIRRREAVGGWLFGIARRVAVRARLEAGRRRHQLETLGLERQRLHADEPAVTNDIGPDYGPLLVEIERLPERFRAAVVLHYFEGLSAEAAAERLGCPRGTVLSRLARARERLRGRLERRRIAIEGLLPAASVSGRLFSGGPVPASLVHHTIHAANCLALAGTAIENVVPATVAALASAVVHNLMVARLRMASIPVVFGVASVAIGLTVAAPVTNQSGPAEPPLKTASSHAKGRELAGPPQVRDDPKGASVVIRGRVLDRDGQPVAGAQVVLGLPVNGPGELSSPRRLAISGPDGRFDATLPRDSLGVTEPEGANRRAIAALAPGLGPDWVSLVPQTAGNELTLRLRRDDVPIAGRLIDLQGRPVAGLSVYTASVMDFPAELLEKLKENAGKMNPGLWGEMRNALILGKQGPIAPVRTGTDGRFQLSGIGRDRGALLLIEGESLEQSFATVYTASNPAYQPLLLPGDGSGERKLFGPRFDLTVAPGRLIEGAVRDRDTGRPIAGAQIRAWAVGMTTSDAQGQFKIPGQPKGPGNQIEVTAPGRPYIKVDMPVGDSPGVGPIHVDIALTRGVWVEGRLRNRANGRPIKARVQYYPLRDNPHLKECPDASFLDNNVSDEEEFPTDAVGKFRAIALPGRGILTVRTVERGFLAASPLSQADAGNVLHAANFDYQMKQYQALVPINPADVESISISNIELTEGRTQHIKTRGPDGRPVTGTRTFGTSITDVTGHVSTGGEFTFVHPEPGKDEMILVVNPDESAGTLLAVKGDESDPITITLQTAGTVTGRLVDEEGRPRPHVPFAVTQDLTSTRFERFSVQAPTGPDGRFRIGGLIPGVSYSVDAIKNNTTNYSDRFLGSIGKNRWTVKPGESQDWGDVQATRFSP
jgi:RNA polymerase sigma factor (sigma-70 family)